MIQKREKLTKLREKNNFTQCQVAEKIGVTTSYYGMIEQGVRTPALDIAKNISDFFCKSIEEIFFD